jgi:hypothetical protein
MGPFLPMTSFRRKEQRTGDAIAFAGNSGIVEVSDMD